MKNKILQILYDLRHQPVISIVTLIGTSLSIFLVMIVAIMQQIPTLPLSPESNRPRLLLGANLHVVSTGHSKRDMSSQLSWNAVKKIYDNLDGIENQTFFKIWLDNIDVYGPTEEMFPAVSRMVDGNFFKVFDHTLVKGRFFDMAESEAMQKTAVITESTAYRLFGDIDPVGQTFSFGFKLYTVIGVVKDHSSLASLGSGDIFVPLSSKDKDSDYNAYTGDVSTAMIVKDGVDFGYITGQVKKRYAEYDTEIAADSMRTVYHGQPYDIETIASGISGSNQTPDPGEKKRFSYMLYAILLLVPAINLSSMLHSRMRRRISEIGVQRAFGCTRLRIIGDIISENFIITVAGGLIGFGLGVIFTLNYEGLFQTDSNFGRSDTPALSTLLDWHILLTAFIFCFILNVISASIPAWHASRTDIVDAINSK